MSAETSIASRVGLEILDGEETAEYLGWSLQNLRRKVRDGAIVAIKLPGGGLRFRADDVRALLERSTTAPRPMAESAR